MISNNLTGGGKRKDMEEIKNDNRVKYIETNPKIYKSESNTERFVNHDLTTSDKVDSSPKIDFNENSPARLEDKENNFVISVRNSVKRRGKFTVTDQTKSDNTSKVRDYPTLPPAKLDSSYMAVAVGVLVTVIIIGPSGVRALPLAAGINEGGHYFAYLGPSGVRVLPLAAGINVGGHYFW